MLKRVCLHQSPLGSLVAKPKKDHISGMAVQSCNHKASVRYCFMKVFQDPVSEDALKASEMQCNFYWACQETIFFGHSEMQMGTVSISVILWWGEFFTCLLSYLHNKKRLSAMAPPGN